MSSVERTINFAVIGLGVGQAHIAGILETSGTRLAAICDADPGRLAAAGEKFGAPTYADYQEMLKNPEIDVVCICTPSGTHAAIGIACAQAGKHVLCEKPLDVTVEKADALIAACRRANVRLGAVFQKRLEPLPRAVRAAVREGRLGRIIFGGTQLFWYRAPDYYAISGPSSWRGTYSLDGGGACMNQGIHSIDALQWMAGAVKTVYAKSGHFTHSIEAEDLGTALLTFESGGLGNITCTTSAYPGIGTDFTIFGEKGSIAIRNDRLTMWRIQAGSEEQELAEEQEMLSRFGASVVTPTSDPMVVTGHRGHVADMAAAVREGRDPAITGEDARPGVALAVAIRESALSGREVEVPK